MDRIPKLCVRLVKGTAKETEDAIWCITEFAGHLVSGHSTGSIIWWNTANTSISKKRRRDHETELKIVRKIDRAHSDVVRTLSVCNLESTNTSFLVSGSWDKSIKLWNAEGLLAAQVSQAHQDWIYCTCDIFDNMFVSGSANGSVRFWKINIEKEEISISAGDSLDCGSEAMCMTLYEWNNKRILGIGTRNVVVLHDATSRFRELRTLEGHTGPVLCLTQWRYFLASGSEDRTVHIWSIDGEVLQILKCSIEWVTSIAVWRGNLCAGYRDWKVRCWSWDDYGKSLDAFIVRDEERIKLKTAYPIFVTSCDVELTGQTLSIKTLCVWKNYLCSASLDGSLRVWRVVLPWEIERLIWIGWHKNSEEESCLLAKLPKELVEHVIKFLK